jgi:hypothetical protein
MDLWLWIEPVLAKFAFPFLGTVGSAGQRRRKACAGMAAQAEVRFARTVDPALTRWAKLFRAYGAECAVVGVREENLQTQPKTQRKSYRG